MFCFYPWIDHSFSCSLPLILFSSSKRRLQTAHKFSRMQHVRAENLDWTTVPHIAPCIRIPGLVRLRIVPSRSPAQRAQKKLWISMPGVCKPIC